MPGPPASRYIAARITATYEGQTVQWKPVYLTGCNTRQSEKFDVIASDRDIIASDRRVAYAILAIDEGLEVSPAVYALDPVMQQAVPYFWNADVYPYALLHAYPDSPKTRFAAVRDWLWMNASGGCTHTKTTCFEDGRVVIPSQDIPPAPARTPSPTEQDELSNAISEATERKCGMVYAGRSENCELGPAKLVDQSPPRADRSKL